MSRPPGSRKRPLQHGLYVAPETTSGFWLCAHAVLLMDTRTMLALPYGNNLPNPTFYSTGQHCSANQSGPVWFLAEPALGTPSDGVVDAKQSWLGLIQTFEENG